MTISTNLSKSSTSRLTSRTSRWPTPIRPRVRNTSCCTTRGRSTGGTTCSRTGSTCSPDNWPPSTRCGTDFMSECSEHCHWSSFAVHDNFSHFKVVGDHGLRADGEAGDHLRVGHRDSRGSEKMRGNNGSEALSFVNLRNTLGQRSASRLETKELIARLIESS